MTWRLTGPGAVVCALSFSCGLLLAAWALGLRLNTSDSVPIGVWREAPLHQPLVPGMIVAVCPPARPIFQLAQARNYLSPGWCASHLEVLFKPVAAIAGDTVVVDARGVSVNGMLLPHSAPLEHDAAGRALPSIPGVYRVPAEHVWVVSSYNAHSFDSRYFGPLPVGLIRGRIQPLWVLRHD